VGGARYLVTGGAGFIGSHLVESLLARGDEVVVLDALSTGRLENLGGVAQHAGMRFVQGSVLDELVVDELVHECDVVLHLAAAVGVKLVIENLLRSLVTNVRGTEVVIEAAHRYRRPILVASTSEIYGKNGNVPLHEESDRIIGPPSVGRWSYSVSKAVDEVLAFAYHRERGLPAVVARLFNTVGPRQSPAYGMVVPRLVRQAVAGEPITVYGDGTQTRCFCHVDDVVRALLALIDHPAARGLAFNVGSTFEISIRALAERIVERAASSSPIVLVPYAEAYREDFEDMMRRLPDISRIRELTGWEPERSLDEILDEVIAEARAENAERALSER
jgi:UDP-glucose 4-epimerase